MFLVQVCQALERADVDYAVVGGYAVALHGAVRGTVDVDLVISLSERAFVAAEEVFCKLGLQSRLPVGARDVFRFREEYIKHKRLVAWSFHDPVRPIDQLDIVITQDLKKIKTTTVKVGNARIRVASIEALIAMKKSAGRPQDLEDVRALKNLLKHEK